jgi:hypothetical protein
MPHVRRRVSRLMQHTGIYVTHQARLSNEGRKLEGFLEVKVQYFGKVGMAIGYAGTSQGYLNLHLLMGLLPVVCDSVAKARYLTFHSNLRTQFFFHAERLDIEIMGLEIVIL